jgi:hypothetical protein
MHAQLTPPTAETTWAGEIPVSDYTWESAASRAYGQAQVSLERDHPLATDTTINSLRGTRVAIPHELMGAWTGVQMGRLGHGAATWGLPCYQVQALFKQLSVPLDPSVVYRNVPAGVVAKRALTLALAQAPGAARHLRPGFFTEAPPLVEAITFEAQSLDSIFSQLMDLSGQEFQVWEDGRVDWTAATGTLYETVLTEGYDFVLLGYQEAAEAPVGMVIVTDQRGHLETAVAPEHALDPTARVVRTRADTTSAVETRVVAEGLLAAGRMVPTVYEIGLLPAGGVIAITIPGSGGSGFTLMGGGFPLMGGGFDLMGGSGGGGDLEAEYPTITAPHWEAIREGTIVRLITPSAGLRGEAPLCRVLSRMFGDAHAYPRVKLASIPPWTTQTLQAAREQRGGYAPARSTERIILEMLSSKGPPIDTARIRSMIDPVLVPELSDLNGAVTAPQVPDLDALNGQIDPLTQANWTHDTSAPTATSTRYITVNLGGTDYKITAESVS